VRGYKSPLHPFLSLSLSLSRPFQTANLHNSFTLLFSPLGSKLVRFGGDLRGIEGKSLESASELISHLHSTSFFTWLAHFVFVTLRALSS
jgi:hypothetical protein